MIKKCNVKVLMYFSIKSAFGYFFLFSQKLQLLIRLALPTAVAMTMSLAAKYLIIFSFVSQLIVLLYIFHVLKFCKQIFTGLRAKEQVVYNYYNYYNLFVLHLSCVFHQEVLTLQLLLSGFCHRLCCAGWALVYYWVS